jgi:hypothetical protein
MQTSTEVARSASTKVTRLSVMSTWPGAPFGSREKEHDHSGGRGPGDSRRTVAGVISRDEDNRRLGSQVQREGQKRNPDDPQGSTSSHLSGVGEFPQHDRARHNLNERVQTEAREGHRSSGPRCHRQDTHSHHVPAQRRHFKYHSTTKMVHST